MQSYHNHSAGSSFTKGLVKWIVSRSLMLALSVIAIWYGLHEALLFAETKFSAIGQQLNLPLANIALLAKIPNPSVVLHLPDLNKAFDDNSSIALYVAAGLAAYYGVIRLVVGRTPAA